MALKSDQEERHNLIAQLKERQGDLARVMSEVGIADDKMPLDEGIKQPLPDLSSQTSQIKTPTMNAKDSIRGTMDMSLFVLKTYFGDIPPGPPVARFDQWVAKRTGSSRQSAPMTRMWKIWIAWSINLSRRKTPPT